MQHRVLARSSPFSYECGGCGRCCHGKRITLSVYELARLAAARGTTTSEILAAHTAESGTVLRFGPNGCTFLEGGRCSVHAGRPLACRLYPIGRYLAPDGQESFVEVEPHPETEGAYGDAATIADWIAAQGAAPYIDAAAKTYALLQRLFDLVEDGAVRAALTSDAPVASDWLDVDAVVTRASAERGEPEPTNVEARFTVYLNALERWIDAQL